MLANKLFPCPNKNFCPNACPDACPNLGTSSLVVIAPVAAGEVKKHAAPEDAENEDTDAVPKDNVVVLAGVPNENTDALLTPLPA